MAIFNLFRRKKSNEAAINSTTATSASQVATNQPPRVPKEIFIEENGPENRSLTFKSNGQKVGIDLIYDYLQIDFERKGYEDAITHPDESYKIDNINLLKMDLAILVQKVDSYYIERLKELDFHIESRKRSGLVDLVMELNSQREVVLNHMEKLNGIKKDIETDNGITKRVELSYQRGFLRGLSSISKSKCMNQKL
ncbi:MAG: hypothetical protein PWR03_1977 [Tenuifilum sp.]|jgi:hypothetical protein|uniref:hypothetical protein n=1 Tax=Tenuifilum sp. TaxID=2760880 RepID=UPI0024ABF42F|nr:hypothetical protein [Tenuifilum sp.]MDI3527794.1 hypothetical protein [Tenuifilum sp.]